MEKWKQLLRDRLAAAINRLGGTPERKAALLETEWRAAVEATEAGRPLVTPAQAQSADESEDIDATPDADTVRAAARSRARVAQYLAATRTPVHVRK